MFTSFDEIARKLGLRAFFIQVGANDGVRDDALRQHILAYSWRGILIEPLPDVFNQLLENYGGNEGLGFIQAAVTDHCGEVEFWRHQKMSTCSGLERRTARQESGPMEKITVPAVTFDVLLEMHDVRELDVLQIDVEGMDGWLLGMFPFERIRPRVIRYEHKHLASTARQETNDLLKGWGYSCFEEGRDTVAYL